MLMLFRHLLSIAALPFVVTVVIPIWLARRNGISVSLGASVPARLIQVGGIALIGLGLGLFAASLGRFTTEGRGTLAPWDPPRRLVVRGPYRYVRNPMISGVLFILFGEALLLGSRPHLTWALVFLALNLLYIPLLEEPQLHHRFGASYQEYRHHVPRFVPLLRPWEPSPDALRDTPQRDNSGG
jgi:protein-S-isoprenylcysteine O-methyltransferase Ste14